MPRSIIHHAAALAAVSIIIASCASTTTDDEVVPVTRAPVLRVAGRPPAADLEIDGQVVDDHGQPVPDVHVQAEPVDVVTDGGGRFAFTAPHPGRYDVTVPELVDGETTGVVHRGATSVVVVVPATSAHGLQLVVRRAGAIAWSHRGAQPTRNVVARAP